MGVRLLQVQTYNPRNHPGVAEVENATSRRRAPYGQVNRSLGGGGNLSTNWLDLGEDPAAALMADWSDYSAANASSSQQTSPVQTSPLQSSSSQSSHDAMQGSAIRVNSGRTSLVETLQTCLTSLPSASVLASPTDPSGASAPSPMRQSRSGGALSGPSTSRTLGPAKPAKRRSRASRRVPTTVLEAAIGDFRDMVQRLTGLPAASTATPVRPQPQRASPSTTFIRPGQRPPAGPSSSVLNLPPPPAHPASTIAIFDDPRGPIHRSSLDPQFFSLRGSNIKQEVEAPFSGSIMNTTRTLPESASWWNSTTSEQSRQIASENVVSNSTAVASGSIGASRPLGVLSLSSGFVMEEFQEPPDLPEPYMSHFDSPFDHDWLSGDDQ